MLIGGFRKHIFIILIGVLIVTSIVCGADSNPYWPQFHGPNRDNQSTETGLLKKWPENGPALIWTARGLGHGYSTVSIAAGMIFGMKEGFVLGGSSYIVSNFFIWGLQGPWTIFQALGAAIAGSSGGVAKNFGMVSRKSLIVFFTGSFSLNISLA